MIINKGYLVELNLATISQGQRYMFADVPQLRYNEVITEGLEMFTNLGLAVSPNLKPIINPTGALGLVLTLVVADTEEIYQIPVSTLISQQNSGLIRELAGKRINIVKSYVTVLTTTGLTAGESCVFYFYYKPSLLKK